MEDDLEDDDDEEDEEEDFDDDEDEEDDFEDDDEEEDEEDDLEDDEPIKNPKPQPIMTTDSQGTKEWKIDGKRHREDGPAIEWADGSKWWYRDGDLHRENGPAQEWADGSKAWFKDGEKIDEPMPQPIMITDLKLIEGMLVTEVAEADNRGNQVYKEQPPCYNRLAAEYQPAPCTPPPSVRDESWVQECIAPRGEATEDVKQIPDVSSRIVPREDAESQNEVQIPMRTEDSTELKHGIYGKKKMILIGIVSALLTLDSAGLVKTFGRIWDAVGIHKVAGDGSDGYVAFADYVEAKTVFDAAKAKYDAIDVSTKLNLEKAFDARDEFKLAQINFVVAKKHFLAEISVRNLPAKMHALAAATEMSFPTYVEPPPAKESASKVAGAPEIKDTKIVDSIEKIATK